MKAHEGNKFYIRADIKGFFSSVTRNKVISSLKKAGLYYNKAKEIADVSTILSRDIAAKHVLPFGFVQSPLLASVALDESALGEFVARAFPSITKTVYADDILFSGNDEASLREVYENLTSKFEEANFALNTDKSHGPQVKTQAFNVEMVQNSLKIGKDRYDNFIDEMKKDNKARAEAIAGYVKTINEQQYEELIEVWNETQEVLAARSRTKTPKKHASS